MHRKALAFVIVFLLFAPWAIGCKLSKSPAQSPSDQIAGPTASAIPTLPIGTPSPDKGIVTGVLLRKMPDGSVQSVGTRLFLAKLLTNQQGRIVPLAGLLESEAPFAFPDQRGQFVFNDVEPATYALVIRAPVFAMLARDMATGEDVVVKVVAGQVIDLGTITVEANY